MVFESLRRRAPRRMRRQLVLACAVALNIALLGKIELILRRFVNGVTQRDVERTF